MTAVDPATFEGADVAGLRSNANGMTRAAGVCDDVRAACQAIVAVSFFLGPFGAAFVHYLETEVIPWLTKISAALNALSKALTSHADAQDDASSPASLTAPSGTGPTATSPVTATDPGTATGSPVTPTIPGSGTAAVGLLQIPVGVAPDGTITPLVTTSPGPGPSTAPAPIATADGSSLTPGSTAPGLAAPHHLAAASPIGGSPIGGSSGGGGSADGGAGGSADGNVAPTGYRTTAPSIGGPTVPTSTAPAVDGQLAAQLAGSTHGGQLPLVAAHLPGASHDGLYSGLGQATGIGAGAAALARAVVVEARRAALARPVMGMPADADSDRLPQVQIFDGALG